MALTNKLTAIADAIRDKTGDTALLTLDAMPVAIQGIEVGGGGGADLPEEALNITGDLSYRFAYNGWNWFIETYGNKIITKDITRLSNTFDSSEILKKIPFVINVKDISDLKRTFYDCVSLNVCPKVRGTLKANSTYYDFDGFIYNCTSLTDIEDLLTADMLEAVGNLPFTSSSKLVKPIKFTLMGKLLHIPSWFYCFKMNPASTYTPSTSYSLYSQLAQYCYSLCEMNNIPVWTADGINVSNNYFSSAFGDTHRIKDITFETDNGTPIKARWKTQTIDLTSSVGYGDVHSETTYKVTDDTTYQAYKNETYWWSNKVEYSRYNHDSAVSTINSLPDTSEYLAEKGGTNTIKFKGAAGSKTDGGAINTLTAEEIAVATAKGWTVTLV